MARCTGILCGVGLMAMLFARGLVLAQTEPAAPPAQHKAAVVVLQGEIDDYSRDGLIRHFEQARATGADVIILQIDTYGGLVTAGLDIGRYIKQAIRSAHDRLHSQQSDFRRRNDLDGVR